jgi:rubredoxin
MLNQNKPLKELRGLTVTEFMTEIESQLEAISKTPGEWGVANLQKGVDRVAWFAECLSKNPTDKEVWMTYRGDVNAQGEFEHEAPMMAVTGNGDNSESRAKYLAFCRNALPSIFWLLKTLLEWNDGCNDDLVCPDCKSDKVHEIPAPGQFSTYKCDICNLEFQER